MGVSDILIVSHRNKCANLGMNFKTRMKIAPENAHKLL